MKMTDRQKTCITVVSILTAMTCVLITSSMTDKLQEATEHNTTLNESLAANILANKVLSEAIEKSSDEVENLTVKLAKHVKKIDACNDAIKYLDVLMETDVGVVPQKVVERLQNGCINP